MSFLSRLFKPMEASVPEPASDVPPIEEKLGNQSDEERLADQKARLGELPEDAQKSWVPTGDVEKQREVDEAERPSE